MRSTCLNIIVLTLIYSISLSKEQNVWQTSDSNQEILNFDKSSEELIENGKKHYRELTIKEDYYGNCWTNAIQSLHTNCKDLNDEVQSRLALNFANCFLKRSGRESYPCDDNRKVEDCLKDFTDRAFNAYTQFFTHTQSVCFYLRSELWQRNTKLTIDSLTKTSIHVKDRLEDASKRLHELNGLQELSIDSQKTINDELIATKNSINDFKRSSAEQRFIVREILDRFIRLQDFVLVEISYGYSLLFFFISLFVVYFITTPVRTNEARLWLFIVLIINLFVERLIASYSVDEQLIALKSTSIVITERIWLARKITLCLMSAIFLWFAITYKNYSLVNHNILNEHTLRLNSIENTLNQLFKSGNIPYKLNHKNLILICFSGQFNIQSPHQSLILNEFSSDGSDSEFTSDSDYNTDASDISQCSEESFDTCSTVAIVSSTDAHNDQASVELEDKALIREEESSPRPYDLRPRKSITYTKSGIIDETARDFYTKIKVSERLSKINTQTTHQNIKNFLSSDED